MTPNSRWRWLAVLAAGFATSCAPEPITRGGARVADLYQTFMVVAAAVFVVVAGLLAYSIVSFRARPGDDELPKQFHTNVALEFTWFAIPQVLVIVLFVMSALVLEDVDEPNTPAAASPLLVHVEGFQWGWRFDYADEGVVVEGFPGDPAEVTLPVGRPITFVLESADVIHSFWVPRWFIKRDVNPGGTNRLKVTLTEEGTYRGVCAEFCGLAHDRMNFVVNAVPQDEFDRWLSERNEGAVD